MQTSGTESAPDEPSTMHDACQHAEVGLAEAYELNDVESE
jgi:hypothetical protein